MDLNIIHKNENQLGRPYGILKQNLFIGWITKNKLHSFNIVSKKLKALT